MKDRKIIVIAHDMRSTHNVGSLMRSAEGFGVQHLYLSGYTPYPKIKNDQRLPHISSKLTKQIEKTALGAQLNLPWSYCGNVYQLIDRLKADGFKVVGLEQTERSINIKEYLPPDKVAIVLGREVEGIDPQLLKVCDEIIEIPMFGKKESFNIVIAAAIAIYQLNLS